LRKEQKIKIGKEEWTQWTLGAISRKVIRSGIQANQIKKIKEIKIRLQE